MISLTPNDFLFGFFFFFLENGKVFCGYCDIMKHTKHAIEFSTSPRTMYIVCGYFLLFCNQKISF